MPKLYEYLGIMIYFWSSEHEPIHVHGRHGGRTSKASIHMFNGIVSKIEFSAVGRGLERNKQMEFEAFVRLYASDIVEKWFRYFVKREHLTPIKVTKRI